MDAIVEVVDVHKSFGDVNALAGASLSIPAGTVYGLLGANGAGKTTLINVLSTLLIPDRGTAKIRGVDVTVDPGTVRRSIGLAGQFAAVDEYLTGHENVEMIGRLYGLSLRDARRRAKEVLDRFNLVDASNRKVSTYSGGMRRRLDLAASLVGRPEVLFLDEPTTGIDPASRLDIWELVRDLIGAGTTVLLTTQYLEEADQLADRIGVIDHGKVISEGTADELKDSLSANTVRLRVNDDELDAARRAIAPIADYREHPGGLLELRAVNGNQTVVDVLRSLDRDGIEPIELALERPNLDDVFLALTGRSTDGNGNSARATDEDNR
ncbi:MAG: ATP-binding cassette domain-containing protein [Acidimicrobiia bacterium]|nr:ATP-binding cassette domain-containing protein [Acidimicrobiia bacterium]